MASTPSPAAFSDLLRRAVTEPGILSSAYSQFHEYSLGNVLLAWIQCHTRKIPLGPIATFPRWKELGRHVRRGEKAIVLCQPVTIKRNAKEGSDPAGDGPEVLIRFIYRPAWFVLAQTDGTDLAPAEVPDWDRGLALERLDIRVIDFASIDGNTMGYARGREIAINPVNPRPFKTLFHEVAHILLGHTAENPQTDSDITPRSLREAEAESVALLCCEALGLGGADEARGYIQHWYGAGHEIPERSAQRVMRVADQIIRAGRPSAAESGDAVGQEVRS